MHYQYDYHNFVIDIMKGHGIPPAKLSSSFKKPKKKEKLLWTGFNPITLF